MSTLTTSIREQFIGEALKPVAGTFDANGMSAGGPGLPRQFHWRQEMFTVSHVLKIWRDTGPCHHGSDEHYVRKHWFEVLTESGETMTIYFERQARSRSKQRWWLYTIAAIGTTITNTKGPQCAT